MDTFAIKSSSLLHFTSEESSLGSSLFAQKCRHDIYQQHFDPGEKRMLRNIKIAQALHNLGLVALCECLPILIYLLFYLFKLNGRIGN